MEARLLVEQLADKLVQGCLSFLVGARKANQFAIEVHGEITGLRVVDDRLLVHLRRLSESVAVEAKHLSPLFRYNIALLFAFFKSLGRCKVCAAFSGQAPNPWIVSMAPAAQPPPTPPQEANGAQASSGRWRRVDNDTPDRVR